MTANKNDKIDAKPAMQYVNPTIWNYIRNVTLDIKDDFDIILMDIINETKWGINNDKEILVLIAQQYGRVETMRSVGLAMRAGEIKYGDWNFLNGHGIFQLTGAMERHALCILDGEFEDKDTSERLGTVLPHYGCIVAGINMKEFQIEYGTSIDDGPKLKEKINGLRIESSTKDTRPSETLAR